MTSRDATSSGRTPSLPVSMRDSFDAGQPSSSATRRSLRPRASRTTRSSPPSPRPLTVPYGDPVTTSTQVVAELYTTLHDCGTRCDSLGGAVMVVDTMPGGDTAWFKPYDPSDSPGPIEYVAERFRRRAIDKEQARARAAAELSRYTLVLVTPSAAGRLGLCPEQAGLILFVDELQDGCKETFED